MKWLDEGRQWKHADDLDVKTQFDGGVRSLYEEWLWNNRNRLIAIAELADNIRSALLQSGGGDIFVHDQRFIVDDLNKLASIYSDEWEGE